jgi:hypothetical protein
VSGCAIPQNRVAFFVSPQKAQLLIQAGYLSCTTPISKEFYICEQHFNFGTCTVPKRLSLEAFQKNLKGSGGGANFTCGKTGTPRSARSQQHLMREETITEASDSGEDEGMMSDSSESFEWISDEEQWDQLLEEQEKVEKTTKFLRLGRSTTMASGNVSTSFSKKLEKRSSSLDVIHSMKREEMVGLLELLSPQELLCLVQKKHQDSSSLASEVTLLQERVEQLSEEVSGLQSRTPLTWEASSGAGLIEIITGHSTVWIDKYVLIPLDDYLKRNPKRLRGRKGIYGLKDHVLFALAVGNGVSIGAIQRKIFPDDHMNGKNRVRQFVWRIMELLVDIYGDGKVNPVTDKKVKHLYWKPLSPDQIQQDSRAAQKTTAASLGSCGPNDLYILIADGSGTVTQRPLQFRDNKMFYCNWKKSTQIRWFIVCTALGRIIYLSHPYPGFLDDTKAIERRFADGSSFNLMFEQEYGPSMRERSLAIKKPVLSFMGDKGYVYYLPPWVPYTAKQGLKENPLLFSKAKADDFPCLVLVTDSAKYEVYEAEVAEAQLEEGGEKTMTSLVDQFCQRRPFVKLRSDIAPVRGGIERVIGRMKTLFPVNAGVICRTQILTLTCFLIISVGIINKMLSENSELFLRDVGVEERDEKKFNELWKLVDGEE